MTNWLDLRDSFLVISSSFSIIGSIYVIMAFLLVRDYHFPGNLVIWLTISNLLFDLQFFILNPSDNTSCILLGLYSHFWYLSSLLWTLVMAFIAWAQFTKRLKYSVMGWSKYFHFAVWTTSAVVSLTPLIFHGYSKRDNDVPKCWIENSSDYASYGEVFLALVVVSALYLNIAWKYITDDIYMQLALHDKYRREVIRLCIYPIGLYLVSSVSVAIGILRHVNSDSGIDIFLAFEGLTFPLQGLVTAIIYGVNSDLMEKIRNRNDIKISVFANHELDEALLESQPWMDPEIERNYNPNVDGITITRDRDRKDRNAGFYEDDGIEVFKRSESDENW